MSIVLPALAVAFCALCAWLTVRIINRRERWAKWTLAGVVGVPLLYVLGFGPTCWIAGRSSIGFTAFRLIYSPVDFGAYYGPPQWRNVFEWYGQIGLPEHLEVHLGIIDSETLSRADGPFFSNVADLEAIMRSAAEDNFSPPASHPNSQPESN